MASRIVPIVLLIWVAVGVAVWLTGSGDDDVPTEVDTESGTGASARSSEPLVPPEVAPAPRLERTQPRETAASLVARMKNPAPEKLAEITAWLRAHPDRIAEWIRAMEDGGWPNYAWSGWRDFFRAVLGPLDDLEAGLAPALIASVRPVDPNQPNQKRLAFLALGAFAPLERSTRRALDEWIRTSPMSPWVSGAVTLLVENAEDGAELVPVMKLVLDPNQMAMRPRAHLYDVLKRLVALGPRGRALVPLLSDHLQSQAGPTWARTVEALIAVGADDPVAHRALVARLTASGAGAKAASKFFRERDDAKQILLAALDDESPRIRVAAAGFLHDKGWASRDVLLPALLSCLSSKQVVWRDRAMRMVPYMAPRAEDVVPTLDGMFRSADETQWVTAAKTLQLLAAVSDGSFDVSLAMEGALRHPNVRVRRLVVQGLMNYPATAAVPMLREALGDDDASVREKASDALGELAQRDASALAALKEAADHTDPQVVAMAEAWLEEIEAAAKQAALEEREEKEGG